MKIEKLDDNGVVYLNYGYKEFKLPRRNDIKRSSDTERVEVLRTDLYTDGDITYYQVNRPGMICGVKINRHNCDEANLLQTDDVYIKNHNFVMTKTSVDEWVDCGATSSLEPVVIERKVYIKNLSGLISLALTGIRLNRCSNITLEQNKRVHIIKKKKSI